MRHRVDHKDLMVRIIGVMNGAARQCLAYVLVLVLFTLVTTVLEVGAAFGQPWGVALPLWVKIAAYALCFLGIVFSAMGAHYQAGLLNRWGLYQPDVALGGGTTVERPGWSLGRTIESAVRGAAVYVGANRKPVPLAQSLNQLILAAASTVGFAPALIFMPNVARAGDPTISGIGLLLWMMFAFSMLRQGFETVGEDVDEMLVQD